jgi:hypothetical protein
MFQDHGSLRTYNMPDLSLHFALAISLLRQLRQKPAHPCLSYVPLDQHYDTMSKA